MLRGHKRNLVYTRKPYRLSQNCLWALECLLQRYGSAVACCRHRGSECSRPGYDITLSEEVAINPTIEPPELTQDLGNRLLEGTNKSLYVPGPRRKEQWPHKILTQTCLWVSRSLWQRHGSVVACWGSGALSVAVHSQDLMKEVIIIFITTGREYSPDHQQKIGLKIYWAWPCT